MERATATIWQIVVKALLANKKRRKKNRRQMALYALKDGPIKEKILSSKHTPLTRHSGRGRIPNHFIYSQPRIQSPEYRKVDTKGTNKESIGTRTPRKQDTHMKWT